MNTDEKKKIAELEKDIKRCRRITAAPLLSLNIKKACPSV